MGKRAFRDRDQVRRAYESNSRRMATVARHAPDGPDKEAHLDQLEAKGHELYQVGRMLDGGYDPGDQYRHN